MNPYHVAAEELAKMVVWSEDSLAYASKHGQQKLAWLLKAVVTEVELEGALLERAKLPGLCRDPSLALPWGEYLDPERRSARGEAAEDGRAADKADEVLKRERAEERSRAQLAVWKAFMRAELRELGLRKDGQLAELLGEPLPGESPEALRRLADEDRRQAEEGLVALMSNGKVSYKHVDELSPEDRPARISVNRARTAWLKERRDGWLSRGDGV